MDFETILEKDSVKNEISREVAKIMGAVYGSYAMEKTLEEHSGN